MFSFQGRASRKEFWNAIVLLFIFDLVVLATYVIITKVLGGVSMVAMPIMAVVLFIFCALFVPLLVNLLAVTVRRYHDRGKSGWWSVLWFISPLWIITLIECGFLKGDETKNMYGEPLSLVSAGVVDTQPAPSQPVTPPVTPTASPVTVVGQNQPAPTSPVVTPPTPPMSGVVQPLNPVQTSPASQVSSPEDTTASLGASTPTAPAVPSQEEHKNVPQARSMSEMLAELQKLSQQQETVANKTVTPQKAPEIKETPTASVAQSIPTTRSTQS